jgi:hypothetical protein
MKNTFRILTAVAALLAIGFTAQAQTSTNPPSFSSGLGIMWDAVTTSTNWSVLGGYGHSTTGSKSIAFGDVAYNFTQNVGVVVGYDYLWAPGRLNEANLVKGGVTLNATVHPFAFIGSTFLTNVVGQPFVADLLAQPQAGNDIGNIVTTGVNFNIVSISNYELSTGAQYEVRTGQGTWDGNYGLIHLAITRTF